MSHLEGIYTQLRATVLLLASPANAQTQYLAKASAQANATVLADDIAEELLRWVRCAEQLAEDPFLARTTFDDLKALDAALASIGGNVADWTPSALTASKKWQHIRENASKILAAMDAHYPAGANLQGARPKWIPAGRD